MNAKNKNLNGPQSVPAFRPQLGQTPHKPSPGLLKAALSLPSANRPVAPPVYKPQPLKQVAQSKMVAAPKPVYRCRVRAARRASLYRPQRPPRVLQTKASSSKAPGNR
jgi:hypothetical protein